MMTRDVKLYDFSSKGFGSNQRNIVRVIDARDHVVTEDISRKIFDGRLESEMTPVQVLILLSSQL